ncbi:MAG TPA: alpha/beta fold hydrolase [Acidimicrobiales bacterium]|nr:alpha/beta fold hydrolase [Acidimicrobiales bacterium]
MAPRAGAPPGRKSVGGPRHRFVLVHGAFHGGWCWARVADLLRAWGHQVWTPTLTGLGERAHLLGPDVALSTMVQDVVGCLEAEEVDGAVLVGHSFGGIPVCGAAEAVTGRLRGLVFLDASLVAAGQRALDQLPPGVAAERLSQAEAFSNGLAFPPFPPAAFGVTEPADVAWLERRLTPHPVRTYQDPLRLAGPIGNGLPCAYLTCTAPIYGPTAAARELAAAHQGWRRQDLAAPHDAMVAAPGLVATTLVELAAALGSGGPSTTALPGAPTAPGSAAARE